MTIQLKTRAGVVVHEQEYTAVPLPDVILFGPDEHVFVRAGVSNERAIFVDGTLVKLNGTLTPVLVLDRTGSRVG